MCGPSGEQTQLEQSQTELANQMQQDFIQRFQGQSTLLQQIQSSLNPIVEAGPDQQGIGPQERAAEQTNIIDTTGANYANAKRALQTTLSARGGGNVALPNGAEDQLQAVLASSEAATQSQQELGVTERSYDLGRQKYNAAVSGEEALLGSFNPTAYAGGAEAGFGKAFDEATQIQQMQNQKEAAIAGGVASVAMDAATFGAGALGGGGFDLAGGLANLSNPGSNA